MTVTSESSSPSVLDAGLPTINYAGAQHPDEAHAIIRAGPRAGSDRDRAIWA